ncbi:MAG: PorT family protein [Flavobacteriales bacterium]|nr:PorT family protein [Flavobacteriales bacterium]
MRSLLALAALPTCLVMHAQESGLRLGVGASVENCPYMYEADRYNPDAELANSARYGGGLLLRADLGKHWVFGTGVLHTTTRYHVTFNYRPLHLYDPFIPNETTVTASALRIPLQLGYRIGVGKFEFVPSAGLHLDVLLNTRERSVFEDGSERRTTFHPLNIDEPQFMIHVEAAINYKVGERFLLGLVPYANVELNTLDDTYMTGPATLLGGLMSVYYTVQQMAPRLAD